MPALLEALAELDHPSLERIDRTLEELSSEYENEERSSLVGPKRAAIDACFRHNEVEKIVAAVQQHTKHENETIRLWASATLAQLQDRSPTSLKLSLESIRRGKKLPLREALEMELRIAGAYCVRLFPSAHRHDLIQIPTEWCQP